MSKLMTNPKTCLVGVAFFVMACCLTGCSKDKPKLRKQEDFISHLANLQPEDAKITCKIVVLMAAVGPVKRAAMLKAMKQANQGNSKADQKPPGVFDASPEQVRVCKERFPDLKASQEDIANLEKGVDYIVEHARKHPEVAESECRTSVVVSLALDAMVPSKRAAWLKAVASQEADRNTSPEKRVLQMKGTAFFCKELLFPDLKISQEDIANFEKGSDQLVVFQLDKWSEVKELGLDKYFEGSTDSEKEDDWHKKKIEYLQYQIAVRKLRGRRAGHVQ